MAAPSEERKQQQVEEEVQAAGYRQPPPCETAGAAPERPPDGGQVWRRRGCGRRRQRSRSVAALSLRSQRLCQHLLLCLLQWFAARPLGQRALQGATQMLYAAERAVTWAGGVTARCPVPFAWVFMMPIVMALIVVRTGADLALRYLDVELPDNRQLVRWLEEQRDQLERFHAVAAQNIRTQAVDPQLTPPPKSAGDKSLYFSPEAHKTSKEQAESEAQQDNTQGEAKVERAQEGKLTPPPESAGDKSMYFSPEAHKTAKEQAESKAHNLQKAQKGKIREQAADVTEDPDDESALREHLAAMSYTEWLKETYGTVVSYSEWMQRKQRRERNQERISELLEEWESQEAEHSRDVGERQQRTLSPERNKKSFWDKVFR